MGYNTPKEHLATFTQDLTMSYQPHRFRWIPPTAWRVLMVLLLLGIVYRLGVWVWEHLAT